MNLEIIFRIGLILILAFIGDSAIRIARELRRMNDLKEKERKVK